MMSMLRRSASADGGCGDRLSEDSCEDSDDECGGGSGDNVKGDEEEALDLSCHGKRPSYEAMMVAAALFQEQRRRRLYDDSCSDDSDGQPMDLGLNPKAYKKSLMKRYRKLILYRFISIFCSWQFQ